MHHNTDQSMATCRIIAWELTRRCPLHCRHCRAAAVNEPHPDELTTDEALALLENIASFARPMIILTGGEPLMRADTFDLAKRARDLGLRTVIAVCGTLLNDDSAAKMVDAGIAALSVSIDGAHPASHDDFRQSPGAFDEALAGIEAARRHCLPVQINTTITRRNLHEIEDILALAKRIGATTFNPFLLVPTGRGKDLAPDALSPEQYESVLHHLKDLQLRTPLKMRVTCAPHYQRILREDLPPDADEARLGPPHGCLGGKTFAFISHTGRVQICGFLETPAGELRENGLDFRKIWQESPFLQQIRNVDGYHGKCGWCEYRRICGGCRARAFALTGDPLMSEPFCVYRPEKPQKTAENR